MFRKRTRYKCQALKVTTSVKCSPHPTVCKEYHDNSLNLQRSEQILQQKKRNIWEAMSVWNRNSLNCVHKCAFGLEANFSNLWFFLCVCVKELKCPFSFLWQADSTFFSPTYIPLNRAVNNNSLPRCHMKDVHLYTDIKMRTLRFLSREFHDKRLTFFEHRWDRPSDIKFRELIKKNGSDAQNGHIPSVVVRILLRNRVIELMHNLHLCHHNLFVHEPTRVMVEMSGERNWLYTE